MPISMATGVGGARSAMMRSLGAGLVEGEGRGWCLLMCWRFFLVMQVREADKQGW